MKRMQRVRGGNRRARGGFTLIELMITAVLMGLIGTMLTTVLVRQQRFHRAVSQLTDARARMRDIETIVPTDLRGISTVAGDVFGITENSMQFRAFTGASVLCAYASADVIELPPKVMVVPSGATAGGQVINQTGTVLTAWINPPAVGDQVFIYDDGTASGNADDGWTRFTIEAVSSSGDFDPNSCTSTNSIPLIKGDDDGAVRYRITLDASPDQTRNKIGAPIRFAREVKYSGYQGADGQWYIGYQTCTPSGTTAAGECGDREVLAGPIKAVTTDTTTSGLYFAAYSKTGVRITTTTDTIAWVSVGIRTTSESLRRSTGSDVVAGGDSLKFIVGIRNRI